MTQDITLTQGNDTLVIADDGDHQWFTVYALEGDDRITLHKFNVGILLGQGNDHITNATDQPWPSVGYWDSPNAIQADLQVGTVKDGWGTTDTLVNIHNITTSGRNGDVVLGSSQSDYIWVNGFWQTGTSLIDGRGGEDTVTLRGPLSSYVIKVSADAQEITLTQNGYTATLLHIEKINVWDSETGHSSNHLTTDFIDKSKVGQAVLLAPEPQSWTPKIGQAVTLTYSFMQTTPVYGGADSGSGFTRPTEAYKQAVRTILHKLQKEIGIQFTEVTDSEKNYGQLRFGANQQTATKGFAYTPGSVSDDRQGDVWMDTDSLLQLMPGTDGWQALLHEIGHALGLSHPKQTGDSSSGPVLIDAWHNNAYTLMSASTATAGLWQSWYGPFDIQALQYLYGSAASLTEMVNPFHRLSDTDGQFLQTLTSEAIHTLDASSLSLGATLDLRPGHFSSVGTNPSGVASWDNVYVNDKTLIQRIYDTPHDDVIWGNALDNAIYWSGGNDMVDGQDGNDTLVIDDSRNLFDLIYSEFSNQFQVSDKQGHRGNLSLERIEKVIFRDAVVRLGETSATSITENTTIPPSAMELDRTAPMVDSVGTATHNNRILPQAQLTIKLNEPVQLGSGKIKLTNLKTGVSETFSDQEKNVRITDKTLHLSGSQPLHINTAYKIEIDETTLVDLARNPLTSPIQQTICVGVPDSLYHFFVIAFDAAPGGIYMDQLAEAYNFGLSVKTIVNIFTTKSQFTNTYAESLTHAQLARKLVDNIVKTSASTQDKNNAVKDITDALDWGMSVGDVVYTVFGNLANYATTDPQWGETANQFQKQTTVSKYFTEVMDYRTPDLPTLQKVLRDVSPSTDVSTTEAIVTLIGMALEGLTPP